MRPDSLSVPVCVVSRVFVRIGTKKFVLINQTQSSFYLEHQSTINSVGYFAESLFLLRPREKTPTKPNASELGDDGLFMVLVASQSCPWRVGEKD